MWGLRGLFGIKRRKRRVGVSAIKGVRCSVKDDVLHIAFGPAYFKQAKSRGREVGAIKRGWWVETCLTDPGYLVRYQSVGWTGSDVVANRVWHQGAEVCAARTGRRPHGLLPTYVGLSKGTGRGVNVRHGGVCPAGAREGSFVTRKVRSGAAARGRG